MNEELTNALAGIISFVVEAKDFVLDQAPDVIHQLLLFTCVSNIIILIFCCMTWWMSYMLSFEWSIQELDGGDWDATKTLSVVGGTITSLIGLGFFIETSLDLLKLLIAPKVWLLEYASILVR